MSRTYLPWPHHPAHPTVAVPTRIDPLGRTGPGPGAARGPAWRTAAPGWFVPAASAPGTDQRIAEAALRLPAHGAVTGWASLRWRGARWFDGSSPAQRGAAPVLLAVGGRGQRPGPGFVVSQDRLLAEDVEVVDGLRVTVPARAVLDEMCRARGTDAAVVVLDMACHDDLVSIAEVADLLARSGPITGAVQVRRAVALADENSWSPPETWMRLLWARSGGAVPLANRPVHDLSGRLVLTPDLRDPDLGLVAEYDGAVHLDRATKQRDVRRDDLHRRHGLEAAVMTASDLADPTAFVARLTAARARAERRRHEPRSWTGQAPRWWIPTATVAQRRALDPGDRTRLLRHRRA